MNLNWLVLGCVNDYKVYFDGHNIEGVNQCKFLGVIIDDKMTWKHHVSYICNKISKGIGILVRARQIFYGETLATLYNALIKPHFTYCITNYMGNTCKTTKTSFILCIRKLYAFWQVLNFTHILNPCTINCVWWIFMRCVPTL